MIKQLALIAGGFYIASKISDLVKVDDSGVVPTVEYDSVDSMSPVDFNIVRDRLMNMASVILDPVKRQETINSIDAWIDAGLSEAQIGDKINAVAVAVAHAVQDAGMVMTTVVDQMSIQDPNPINTDEDLALADPADMSAYNFEQYQESKDPVVQAEVEKYAQAQAEYDAAMQILNNSDPNVIAMLGPEVYQQLKTAELYGYYPW